MENLGFLGGAYAIFWIAIGAYLASIARRQRSLERRLEELRKKQAE